MPNSTPMLDPIFLSFAFPTDACNCQAGTFPFCPIKAWTLLLHASILCGHQTLVIYFYISRHPFLETPWPTANWLLFCATLLTCLSEVTGDLPMAEPASTPSLLLLSCCPPGLSPLSFLSLFILQSQLHRGIT